MLEPWRAREGLKVLYLALFGPNEIDLNKRVVKKRLPCVFLLFLAIVGIRTPEDELQPFLYPESALALLYSWKLNRRSHSLDMSHGW